MEKNRIFEKDMVKDRVFEKSANIEVALDDENKVNLFTLLNGVNIDLYVFDYSKNNHIEIFVNEDSSLNLHILSNRSDAEFNILANVNKNGVLNIYFADLTDTNMVINSHVILLGDNSKSTFKFASIANKNVKKSFNIGFDHLGVKTISDFEGYGVATNNGEIDAKGISHIEKNSIKSYANQTVKVILFDKESKAKASPTLKIDCDDIVANHACAIGSLNEDHVFYLKSRGLSEEESRRLITLGYLMPISNYFNEKGKNLIETYVKENF